MGGEVGGLGSKTCRLEAIAPPYRRWGLGLMLCAACGGSPAAAPQGANAPPPQSSETPESSDEDSDGPSVDEDCEAFRVRKLDECTKIATCDADDEDCDPSMVDEMRDTCRELADIEKLVCHCTKGSDEACQALEDI